MSKKVVLITGASSGIGKATAERLLNDGYTVYAAARRVERMDDLKAKGGIPVKLDITREEDIIAAVKKVIDEQGQIDVLYNNAGYGLYGPVEALSLDKARYQFDVNIFGLARMTQEVLPHMRKQKSGIILNTSSMGGKMYTPFGAWYHATKHALEGFSDCLRLEVASFGIKVVIIEPGLIETEFSEVVGNEGDLTFEPYRKDLDALNRNMAGGSVKMSPPSVIADVVAKAIKARNPKTRYVAGSMGKMFIRMRKLLGDKGFDNLLRNQMLK